MYDASTKVRKFETKNSDAEVKDRARAFQSLLLSALLVSADAADGASDLVEPLCACADKLFPATNASPRKGKKQQQQQLEEDGTEVTGIELLCDCLLSFLELPSAFLRTTATNAFEAFSGDMTKASIGLLLSHFAMLTLLLRRRRRRRRRRKWDMEDDEEASEGEHTSATAKTRS